jgi:hypothetical protein
MTDISQTFLATEFSTQGYVIAVVSLLAAVGIGYGYLPILFRQERQNHNREPGALIREGLGMAVLVLSAGLSLGGLAPGFVLGGVLVAAGLLLTSKSRLIAWLFWAVASIAIVSWRFFVPQ